MKELPQSILTFWGHSEFLLKCLLPLQMEFDEKELRKEISYAIKNIHGIRHVRPPPSHLLLETSSLHHRPSPPLVPDTPALSANLHTQPPGSQWCAACSTEYWCRRLDSGSSTSAVDSLAGISPHTLMFCFSIHLLTSENFLFHPVKFTYFEKGLGPDEKKRLLREGDFFFLGFHF